MTRGPGILGYLSVTKDFRTLAYFSVRLGDGDVFLRDLTTGAERILVEGPAGPKGYPALSPSGIQLAFGQRIMGGEQLAQQVMPFQEPDGSWWDYAMWDYHKPYGTAFAIMTLLRCL